MVTEGKRNSPFIRYQKGNLPHIFYDVKTKVTGCKWIDKNENN